MDVPSIHSGFEILPNAEILAIEGSWLDQKQAPGFFAEGVAISGSTENRLVPRYRLRILPKPPVGYAPTSGPIEFIEPESPTDPQHHLDLSNYLPTRVVAFELVTDETTYDRHIFVDDSGTTAG